MAKNAVAKSWTIKPSYDGMRYSQYQAGDKSAPAPPATFSTTFSATENPLSESGAWSKTNTLCPAVLTASGKATSSAYTSANNDSYARLASASFTATSGDYEVVCTYVRGNVGLPSGEAEVLMRLTDNSTQYFGYELLYNNGGGELVRIDGGGIGGFTEFLSTAYTVAAPEGDGDKIKVRVTGTNPVRIQMWHAKASAPTVFTQYVDYSDSDAARRQTGQPGIGFYQLVADNDLGNAGWNDFTVTAV
jgi:hypothetical protein